MLRRVATPDLMLGHMIAPPPSHVTSQLEALDISGVLECFSDRGSPISKQLSPVTVVSGNTVISLILVSLRQALLAQRL